MNAIDYNKKCILTPTFIGHFQYLNNYLKSFRLNVEDKSECIIYFIINVSENSALRNIISNYKDLNIRVLFFEDILEEFGINKTPEYLLEKYGKFSFQALKKFYGMLYLENYKHFLVLDTESIWLNKTNMTSLFDNFFNKDPFIVYSNVDKRLSVSASNKEASDNINFILNSACDKWFVEQYIRFWDVDILKDIFKNYGSCFEIVNRIYEKELNFEPKLGLFESVLYDQYVYEHADKYGYRCIDLDKECEKYLEQDVLLKYRKDMAKIWKGSCGLLESSSIILDKNNYKGFAKVFKKNNLNIIRIETEIWNYKYQKLFLDIVQPNILTCSQENLFGVNLSLGAFISTLIFTRKYAFKIKRNVHILMQPFHYVLDLFVKFIKIPIYIFKGGVKFISNISNII